MTGNGTVRKAWKCVVGSNVRSIESSVMLAAINYNKSKKYKAQ
jgi:hypothetical protein